MTEVNYGAFHQAHPKNFAVGRVSPIRLVVVHCTEGAESEHGTGAEGVMNMFASANSRQASATVTCDNNSIARSLHDKDTPYAAVHANSCGLHEELVGMAEQSRAQWLDPVSKATIANGARVARDWCNLYGLRKGTLTDAQLHEILHDPHGTHLTGITTHAQISRVWPSTGHTDPGANFPMDYFMSLVTGAETHPAVAAHAAAAPAALVGNPYHKPVVNSHTFIRNGSRGDGVKFVQWAIYGFDPKHVDGIFGDGTEAAVKAFQKKVFPKSPKEWDGVVGTTTLGALALQRHHR